MSKTNAKSDATAAGDQDEGLAALQAMIARAGEDASSGAGPKRGLPPVERWEPERLGELDIVIKRDGTWFYMGTPIRRMPLVRLFSTVLRKDADGKTYLVTPVEKIEITVEDAHFVAVEMNVTGTGDDRAISFRTNVGDIVEADADHPIRFSIAESDGVKPYVNVRGRLEAVAARPVMYELIEQGEEIEVDGRTMFAVRSHGAIFPIMPAAELERQVSGR